MPRRVVVARTRSSALHALGPTPTGLLLRSNLAKERERGAGDGVTSEPNAGAADQRRLNPAIAALLTLVGPGLGFFYVGRTQLATVAAVVATLLPVAALVALAMHALATGSTQALNPIVGGGAIGVDIVAWAITLVVAVWAAFVAARRRTAPRKGPGRLWGYFAIWLLPMIAALLIGLTIRFLWLQPFNIPSGDMQPTLRVHTLVLANKAAYGYGRYSFALLKCWSRPNASRRVRRSAATSWCFARRPIRRETL